MTNIAQVNFVRQQGFTCSGDTECGARYSALRFQPKIIGVLVAIGLVLQSWPLFLALAIISWWNVAVPGLNPFDFLYNLLVAGPKGLERLGPAPLPRRFAQGMAGTFMLAAATFLFLHWYVAAVVVEVMLVGALTALIFGKLCLGSYIYHLIRGEAHFANHTLPWAHA